MAEGLVKPVATAYANRTKVIDDAVDNAVKGGMNAPVAKGQSPIDAAFPDEPSKPTTAAEAQARMDTLKARQAADDKAAKGLVKPSMGDRLKKLVGLD